MKDAFAPLRRYLHRHPDEQPLPWQYMGSADNVHHYRARETDDTPRVAIALTPFGTVANVTDQTS